ncbi:MAG: phosphate acyltransferase PlsX [Pelagibacteraceae bacterium]|nr:phosphate acyltransferase PlsX [Pelagibacteraceae bacterium]
MNKKFNIAVDAMGGDNSPEKVLEGVNLLFEKNINARINLYGDENIISSLIKKYKNINNDNCSIIHSPDVVPGETSVRDAIKLGKKTSMWMAIDSVKTGQNDIIVSSGNTGALLVMSKLILKMIEGLDKPALAAVWPNFKGCSVVLDLGANVECSDNNLVEFSIMGSELYKTIYNETDVSTALLNIGSEEIKGHESIKSAHNKLLSLNNLNLNYKGFIEGSEIKNGNINVIVTDGFTGNVALKTAEGTANFITTEIKNSFSKSISSKIGYLFSYFAFREIKKKLDPRKYNGAIFLGLNAPVIKSHGGADAFAFFNSLDLSYRIISGNLINKIKANFINTNVQ